MPSLVKILIVLCVSLSVCSCTTDDLCHDCGLDPEKGDGLDITFDWSDAPEGNPEGMRVAFHSLDYPGNVVRYDLPGTKGGHIPLSSGRYAVLTYNNDSEYIRFDNLDDWQNARIHTDETEVTSPMTSGRSTSNTFRPIPWQSVCKSPDALWSASIDTLELPGTGGSGKVTLRPEPMFCNYDFTLTNVRNLETVRYMSASISGLADGVNLHTGKLSAKRCTLAVPALRKDSTTVKGSFKVFGNIPNDTVKHMMELYVVNDKGVKYRLHGDAGTLWDVTSQVDNAPDPRNVHISVTGVEIPMETGDSISGGMLPEVDNWDDVHVTVPL